MDDAKSEPHSIEITYLHDVLTANFPKDRVFWDLHHYFILNKIEENRRFDISWFQNFLLPTDQSHYKAWEHENRIPDLVINILSVSTWKEDLSDLVEFCREIRIPYYVVFAPYHVASRLFTPPFLRVYKLIEGDKYEQIERHNCVTHQGQNDWDDREIISLGEKIPFNIGLEQLSTHHESGSLRYRLILGAVNEKRKLLTAHEQLIHLKDQEIILLKDELAKYKTQL